ncbi:ribonucleotide reductase beta subunit family protein with ferritin-like domain [Acidovorax soli]|jgi:ribonucleotide reductase beta subunit family protein with ferritin-like domain|uniref:Ribonucleotide reductase beta subunit family protein with ferritin-like domain n=1 Tax=Acidovorax soli TaxID=592050 RepID=A0A7X0PHF2_9BURK|nr:hypothetical protein [Acidovorax soli]MBB6561607.1 ribonucleotide reductase beta subunit family protein with ferritin-like domain [Acidovorax soli]
MSAIAYKDTYQLVFDRLTEQDSTTAERTARLLAQVIDHLEQRRELDRQEIEEMVHKLG